MMRTTLSVLALFAALILVGKAVNDSVKRPAPAGAAERQDWREANQRAKQPAPHDASMRMGAPASWAIAPPLFGILDDDTVRMLPPPGWREAECPCCSGVDENVRLTQFEELFEPEESMSDEPSDDGQGDNEPAEDAPERLAEKPTSLTPIKPVPLGEIPAPPSDEPAPVISTSPLPAEVEKAIESKSPSKTAELSTGSAEPEAIKLSPQMLALRNQVRDSLAYYYVRNENVANRSPWGIMHAFIPYGVDSQIVANGKRVNAAGYLCYNGACRGQQLLYTKGGELQARIGVGVQGHPGQFLAMLAQSRVPKTYPIKVGSEEFTVADLIEHEKRTCKSGTELTFKLIALSCYLKSDETWQSEQGDSWSIQRLIQEELRQPIVGAACGGTHRLTGFSYAVRMREFRKEPLDGQWLRAKRFVEGYHDYIFRLQNPDGSFSTDWFKGRADTGVISRRLETTGHMTEWLVYSLPQERLQEPRVVRAVNYLSQMLIDNRGEKWSIGPLGHGLHALCLYDERVFGAKPGQRAAEFADHSQQRKFR